MKAGAPSAESVLLVCPTAQAGSGEMFRSSWSPLITSLKRVFLSFSSDQILGGAGAQWIN
jgi:hypothetical protein